MKTQGDFVVVYSGYCFEIFCSDSADKVVKGEGKYEELVVCSQEIAASTTQLVVASKVKADRNSQNLQPLSEASKDVTQAAARVVASAKSAAEAIEESGELSSLASVVFTLRFAQLLVFHHSCFLTRNVIGRRAFVFVLLEFPGNSSVPTRHVHCISDTLDFSRLTLHQAKRLEMEAQVNYFDTRNTGQKMRLVFVRDITGNLTV